MIAARGGKTYSVETSLNGSSEKNDQIEKRTLQLSGCVATDTDNLEAAFISCSAPMYQRGGQLVTIGSFKHRNRNGSEIEVPQLKEVETRNILDFASRHLSVEKLNSKKEYVLAKLNPEIANTWLARPEWEVPAITGIVNAPVIVSNGTILSEHGYDKSSGLYYAAPATSIYAPATKWADAEEAKIAAIGAMNEINRVISEYAFASPEDKAVALAMILSPHVLHADAKIPFFAIDGSGPGVGKGILVDAMSVIVTGKEAPAISFQRSDEEFAKHVDGLLIQGIPVINIDNIERPIEGDLLCSLFTQATRSLRPLGGSKVIQVDPRLMLVATGNNLTIKGDMTRRTLKCRIDPKKERPELTNFSFHPVVYAKDHRETLHQAVLTIVAAHAFCGFPGTEGLSAFGSFEEWSKLVRAALVWMGERDPCSTMNELRESDPVTNALARVLIATADFIGTGKPFMPRDLIDGIATANADKLENLIAGNPERFAKAKELTDAFAEVLDQNRLVKGLDARAIGTYFQKNVDRIVSGHKVVIFKRGKSGNTYKIEVEATK